jgi:hypothetical protein
VFIANTDGLLSYVDGRLYSTVSNPMKRPFLDIRFKPTHYTKYVVEKRFQTNFTSILFYDNYGEALNNEVTSKSKICLINKTKPYFLFFFNY